MCAVLGIKKRVLRPGKPVRVHGRDGSEDVVWAGFARKESLGWWKKQQAVELVDVPAERFAERSDKDGQLRWAEMEPGQVVRGVVDATGKHRLLKVVTRASTAEELSRYEHDRMPLVEAPIYSAEVLEPPAEAQGELF